MNRLIALGIVGVVGMSLAGAQDKVTFEVPASSSAKVKHQVDMNLGLMGMEATVSLKLTRSVEKRSAEGQTLRALIEEMRVEAGGEEIPTPATDPLIVQANPEGLPKSITGGFAEVDMTRLYMTLMFVVPIVEMEKDKPWKQEAKAQGEIPALTVETTYLGPDKVGDETLWKFKTSVKEANGLTAEGQVWARKDMTIVKQEVKYSGLPIPAVGAEASGTVTLKLIP
ncbi:MAG TPA: hypothetical protein PLO61_05080 [Fimbriimonadaceae bacterium]|nr:hypothetical protein [Fimbriimonadaceae bacterium]HRJ32592.1 hypothetical protein [Fimbriimonadaceae bacterium]